MSYAVEINFSQKFNLSLSIDPELEIKTDNISTPTLDTDSGLPRFIYGDTLSLVSNGIHFVKPVRSSIGFSFLTHGSTPVLITGDCSLADGYSITLNDSIDYFMKNTTSLRMGFEYITLSKVPIRVGLVYKQSPF